MSGRNKRLAQAFLRQMARDIAKREQEEAELQSAREWRRTGAQGLADELTAILGGTSAGVRVFVTEDWQLPELDVGIRYRGNAVGVRVAITEARLRRTAVLNWLADQGRAVTHAPCRHEQRPVAKRELEPPMAYQDFAKLSITAMARSRLHCPDCDAVVG
jgi:hypothetical protein